MPDTPPLTGPHSFSPLRNAMPTTQASPEDRQAVALEFLAERLAGIEWQLVELNQKLFQVVAHLSAPTNP